MATYKVLHRNRIEVTVPNVLSETQVDETVYDTETYRDDPSEVLLVPEQASGEGASFNAGAPGISGYYGHATVINSTATQSSTPAAYASDLVTHTAPRFLAKKRTKLKLWSQAAGAGDLLWSGWVDRLESWGVSTASTNV